jgi:tripartite-type tricarboxylate transporter receptor subunit TctC
MKILRYLVLGLAIATGAASPQSFPDKSKPLRILVPSGVGSTGDLLARVYGRGITEVSGQPVVVENKPGAEGVIGIQAAKAAPPDGYTIMMTSNSTQVLNVLMMPNVPYDPVADFVPLTGAGVVAMGMYVSSPLPFKNAGEFFAAARANPGKYTYGSSTTVGRLAAEMVEQMAGIKMLPVNFRTLPEVMTAVGGGQVDMAFGTLSTADPMYKAGRVRPLAVSGRSRLNALPDVPTMREAGLADYDVTSWLAFYAPTQTPPAIAAALRDVLRKAGKTSYVTEFLNTFAMQPLDMAGDELTALQRSESDKLGKVLRAKAGLDKK